MVSKKHAHTTGVRLTKSWNYELATFRVENASLGFLHLVRHNIQYIDKQKNGVESLIDWKPSGGKTRAKLVQLQL